MKDKITSIRIKEELWRNAKILAIEEGITFRALIEELLESVVQGARLAKEFQLWVQNDVLEVLMSRRERGQAPLTIVHEKTAVELVREGRGE